MHEIFCNILCDKLESRFHRQQNFLIGGKMAGYSSLAQPFLDAIAEAVFSSTRVRKWLIKGTPIAADYDIADVLRDEQQTVRWHRKPTTQPFWANYWCGRDSRCQCRIPGSKALESDAIFFLRSKKNRVLAVHIEFKHPKEPFGYGQPEAYPLRAECWSRTHTERKTVNPHDDWTTVLFCGPETLGDSRIGFFQRVITHAQAAAMIDGYPRLAP